MPALPTLLSDAANLAHRHVEGHDRIRFIRLPREAHGAVPFITDEYLGERAIVGELPVDECLALDGEARLGFLFHSAFCGSTMLARAFDRPGVAMGLSEPMLLNDVVGFRRRGADPRAVARLADAATRALARPFGPGEMVIVKPSNVINPLAALLMALRPGAKALFLYAPLEEFLISVAGKGLACRLWARELLEGYLKEGAVSLGFESGDYFRHSDLQVAAVGWLAQQQIFAGLAGQVGGARLASLDTATLTARPEAALAAVARHYGLTLGAEEIAAIAAGPAFTRHAKSGEAYNAATRDARYAATHAAHADEIEKVCVWAEAVARHAGVAMVAANPLPL